jgi:hypothetical protein
MMLPTSALLRLTQLGLAERPERQERLVMALTVAWAAHQPLAAPPCQSLLPMAAVEDLRAWTAQP